MATVVVGGHSRDVGKTSVVCGLIQALQSHQWTAVKISQFGHGICSLHGEPCDCALLETEHSFSLDDETDRSGKSDTSRFLVAGAMEAVWMRTRQGMLAEAMPALRERLLSVRNVIIESNSVVRFLRPDLYLAVLDPAVEDFKTSAQEFLDRADAVIVHSGSGPQQWKHVSLKAVEGTPQFPITPPRYVTSELVEFVQRRLEGKCPAAITG